MAGIRSRRRGELEQQVMKVLWAAEEPLGATQVRDALQGRGPVPAYTTVITVLDRLTEKGMVVRHGDAPRRVRFTAARSEEEQASLHMRHTLDEVDDRRAALLRFAGELTDDDLDVLRRALRDD
ncbi:BlaI/MecI/CopY family transcriptional regulator [Pseudoclavibacter caeni]|jgi:predicted transcriptional regulator|uniref:BlaI/MecI/CopY family transcriptional regulator n=1 Tax=Pseudoclavibacter caeni TaxID=908846 RepID=A0A7C8FRV1_9MICO|nr:BlaI/MecI/CopY family transcriptional regulator [Pseudoclavibacter caeni]KAB1631112.1 BlaI/MecI/CopY family transcriptional regulator [Pseudoclavibacter caeni]NYJ97429.1 putative transcriptional regulator [Pseudoclavibacter caeni]